MSTFKWLGPIILAVLIYTLPFKYSATLDLPNHLARAHIIGKCLFDSTAEVCRHYDVSFLPIPYFLSDSLLLAFEKILPTALVERGALIFLLLLFLSGWDAIFKSVNRTRNIAFLAGLLVLLNNFLNKGFYAYLLGIALSLHLLAWWWPRRDTKSFLNSLILSFGLAVIFCIHLAGFVVTFVAITAYDLHVCLRTPPKRGIAFAIDSWPFVLTFCILYLAQQYYSGWSAVMPSGFQDAVEPASLAWLQSKLMRSSYVFINYDKISEVALILVGLICTLLSVPIRKWRSLCENYWAFLAVILAWLYILTPDIGHGAADVDLRFLIPMLLCLLLAIAPNCRMKSPFILPLILSLIVNFIIQMKYKIEAQVIIGLVDRAIQSLPPNDSLTVFSAYTSFPSTMQARANPFAHLGNYYILRGGSLVDGFFECSMNRNTPYICFKDQELWHSNYSRQFGGLRKISAQDWELARNKFNYFVILDPEQERVAHYFSNHSFQQLFNQDSVYLFKKLDDAALESQNS